MGATQPQKVIAVAVDDVGLSDKIERPQHDKFGATAKNDPQEIALVRKVDWHMMPILALMYFMSSLDRNALVNGKINTLTKDLHLQGYQYNTCIAITFVGLIVGVVPSNMILSRVRPSWWMSGWMMAWALITTLNCIVKDYQGLIVCRFLLGIAEAPFYPGAQYLISMFYTRKEIATRMALLWTGNTAAAAFGGLIAAGVFANLSGAHGMGGWRWLFLIQGILTVVIAIAAFFLLPNSPLDTPWLTPEERRLAYDRIARDTTEKRISTTIWTGLREAVTDRRVWIFAFLQQFHAGAANFKNFLPTAIKGLGFSSTVTLVLVCPPYLLAVFTNLTASWSSGRFNERTWHITIQKFISIIGFAIGAATTNVGARYFAFILFVGSTYGVNNISLGWTAAVIGQTDEKKAIGLALVNSIGNIAFVYTPYLWPDSDTPQFVVAMSSSCAFSAAVIVCVWIMRWDLQRENRRIKASEIEAVNLYVY
ncbi:putative MFS transporter [Eremomyces bilateralis CBS 781.70]|uniref:MFS transporter n=1 Tax=Eremomyces bilateralis CBS 781.70 TaxID=1392243 RepID=A0A6G1G0T4_9PEZI|nr:putative MFS transporter [Eremomyces bilateralis CBS 781.70]KAF1811628.1 putative MFS transporter [Eremomyces bilateralis CBS 781.70]